MRVLTSSMFVSREVVAPRVWSAPRALAWAVIAAAAPGCALPSYENVDGASAAPGGATSIAPGTGGGEVGGTGGAFVSGSSGANGVGGSGGGCGAASCGAAGGTGGLAGAGGQAGSGGAPGSAGAGGAAGTGGGGAPACLADEKLCGVACRKLDDPAFGCAAVACDPCSSAQATATCSAGACALGTCDAGWDDCDGSEGNGCETNLQTSGADCGVCGNVCSCNNCIAGACVGVCCSPGTGDCDGVAANGCEASLDTLANCGACGQPCSLPHATTSCTGGTCALVSCEAGWDDCDGDEWNGCEENTDKSISSCGACDAACVVGNGTPGCATGACLIAACSAPYSDCDGLVANGCEANLQTSLMHCGGCSEGCTNVNGTTVCIGGACKPTCNAGKGDCDANPNNGCETNTNTSLSDCGACGASCGGTNMTATCVAGVCSSACKSGFGDCDGNAANGCEIDLSTLTDCGACGAVCGGANATPVCALDSCNLTCDPGFGDCDGAVATGCETNVLASTATCGSCGTACSNAHGTTVCQVGVCKPTCAAGYGDCDGDLDNGCETDLQTSTSNCGACGLTCDDGNVCTQTDTCQNGTCVYANPVICAALDPCHVAGTCDQATGLCSNPNAPNGAACDDGNACTQTDSCQTGTCTGANPVVCAALDTCHVPGTCNQATGVCTNPNASNGKLCNDGSLCTQTDTCQNGTCVGGNPKVCPPPTQCQFSGVCNSSTGTCSYADKSTGTSCNDGLQCTSNDMCTSGVCAGTDTCAANNICDFCSPLLNACAYVCEDPCDYCVEGGCYNGC